MPDDKRNSTDSSSQSPSSIDDFVDLADRTIDKTVKGLSKIVHDYGGEWNDSIEDTLTSTLPSFVWGGRERFNQQRDAWLGDNWVSHSSNTAELDLKLDETKPNNIWAFPVPSTKQYAKCKELEGSSVWTQEGVWRCLFPKNKHQLNKELNATAASDPEDRKLFGDYSSYLDWKSVMRSNMAAQRQRERQEMVEKEKVGTKYISQSEAEKSGKRVISSSMSSQTISKDDGSLETKQVVQKWYEDGTSSLTETVSTSPDHAKGWFWK